MLHSSLPADALISGGAQELGVPGGLVNGAVGMPHGLVQFEIELFELVLHPHDVRVLALVEVLLNLLAANIQLKNNTPSDALHPSNHSFRTPTMSSSSSSLSALLALM